MARLLLLNGPNLNLLGRREPHLYGSTSLADIEQAVAADAQAAGHQLDAFQTNSEAALVDRIQQSAGQVDFILLNPGALTHTSVALRDALLAIGIPFIEIHLSNVYAREEFRRHSYVSDVAVGVISGLGALGYQLALQAACAQLARTPPK
ncbi:MAG: type II 3-dehydroquinate dehydratase [Gammaproteobacteria bacterium]|nr:type II 3-dehydroquinate dehydratase [Gammaproteobacteria bacterium]